MSELFAKVLIANRGEIAVRIARTVQQMGMRAVAVYSTPDRAAPHVAAADEAYPLEGETSADTYLRGDQIIEIALACGADAVHPGYGFLAENADFADACARAGLTFVGPSPEAMRAMGDKLVAKRTMAAAGVPVVPGGSDAGPVTESDAAERADAVGYPVLVKAAAGGGGKGMRIVEAPDQLAEAVAAAGREAQAAFGDGRVFIEKFVPRARHVEFQIFGDATGNVVHLFERECSVQRRHQKIIEEAPAPALVPETRVAMGKAAVQAARAIGYTNAGTVEFMVDEQGGFYFLEVNARLQVEHPVTELTVQHDLVAAQLLVASGAPMPFDEASLQQTGHAIECRVYAEDPSRGFLPSTGTIEVFETPRAPGVRVDTGVAAGTAVTVHYDPMLAKVVTWGRNREEARVRMRWTLERTVVLGVTTNIAFLRDVLDHPAFAAGALHTGFLEEHRIEAAPATPDDLTMLVAGVAAQRSRRRAVAGESSSVPSPWQAAGPWRGA